MKFTLKIKLGNDAMQTGTDIAEALRKVALRIEDSEADDLATATHLDGTPLIRDTNGNLVGEWAVR